MSLLSRDGSPPPDDDVGPVLMWISGVLAFFVITTTFLRLYVRVFNRIFGWDDGTILIACLTAVVRLAFLIKQSQHGNGRHRVYIKENDYMMINMYGWYAQIFLFTSVAFLKVSICLLLLRIKDTKPLRILLYIVMGGVIITNFGVVFILLAECRPAGFWRGASAQCWPTQIRIYSIYATISYSVLTDLVCSLLPLVVVWKVKIPLKTKVLVCGLMSLGLIATGFGIARAASLGISTSDLSYVYCIAAIWSNLELFLGIIAANLALSRSIYIYFFGTKEQTASRGTGNSLSNPSFFSNKLRGDHVQVPSTFVESKRRRSSMARSSNSDIPLEPGIQKKTEFWLTEEDPEAQRRR